MSIHRYRLKDGIGWRAIVQISPTKQVSKKFRRKIDAEAWERTQLANRDRGVAVVSSRSAMTVEHLAARWLEDHSKQRKAASSYERDEQLVRRQITPHLGSTRITELAPAAVETWMTTLRGGRRPLRPKTCNHALGLLKKMLNDAVRWRLAAFNPIQHVSPFKIPQAEYRFWSRDEAATFLNHVAAAEPERYPVFMLALNTGMRRGELRALTWDCVNLDHRQITVKASWCDRAKASKSTKSGKIRQVPINGQLQKTLIELRVKSKSPLVLGGIDFPLSSTREMTRLSKEAGVVTIRFHDLRHTFASHFMMNGGKIYDLQKLLGHSTITMTERYSHLSPDHLRGATDILGFGAMPAATVIALQRRQ